MSDGQILLAVAGNIGSGKTTLTRLMASSLGFQPLFEPSDENPYLSDFYQDMSRYALPLQLRFLADRVEQMRQLAERNISAVQDRTCYEDVEIFARNLHEDGKMDERDWGTYGRVARPLLAGLPVPDLLVYLQKTPETCASAVRKRGREFEQSLPDDYLSKLGARYDQWFDNYDRGPKLRIVGDALDVLERPEDLRGVVESVRQALPQRVLAF